MKEKSPKPSYVLIMLMLINIVGCQNNLNQTKKKVKHDTIRSANKLKYDKIIPTSNNDTVVVSQEFSYDALAFNIFNADTNKIKSLFLDSAAIKMEKQTNDQGGSYYEYNFTDGINKLVLFPDSKGDFCIKDSDITNDRFLLNKKISIGMKEDVFMDLLKVKNIKCDTITVKDEELTFESVYVFKNARLRQIKMGSIVE